MIAIYDQGTKIIIAEECVIHIDMNLGIYLGTSLLGSYKILPQAQYVLDQIAFAIEQGKPLYQMPSVEEVGYSLSSPCSKCIFDYDKTPGKTCTETQYYKCYSCVNKSSWQPKE